MDWPTPLTRKSIQVIVAVLALLFLFFFGESSIVNRIKNDREITRLNKEIKYYQDECKETEKHLEDLKTNPDALEKIAREKYLMKKDNEDVYVFEE